MSHIIQTETQPGWYKIEMKLNLKSESVAIEAYMLIKKLEVYVRKKFHGVRDFKCNKKLYEQFITCSFFHCGQSDETEDISFEEVKLLES